MIKRIPVLARLLLLFVLQAGILGWMIWDRVQILETGQTVRLAVEPVDPRDIFRGYYVTLNYEISRIRPTLVGSDDDFAKDDIVYVSLKEGTDGLWQVAGISQTLQETQPGQVTIAGRVTYARSGSVTSTVDAELGCANPCQMVVVRYGIEQYFTQQDASRNIELARQGGEVEILAAVNTSGTAAIKGIIVDGILRYEEPLL
jgi:uncharacterized membrane-anchored protein